MKISFITPQTNANKNAIYEELILKHKKANKKKIDVENYVNI